MHLPREKRRRNVAAAPVLQAAVTAKDADLLRCGDRERHGRTVLGWALVSGKLRRRVLRREQLTSDLFSMMRRVTPEWIRTDRPQNHSTTRWTQSI